MRRLFGWGIDLVCENLGTLAWWAVVSLCLIVYVEQRALTTYRDARTADTNQWTDAQRDLDALRATVRELRTSLADAVEDHKAIQAKHSYAANLLRQAADRLAP